MKNFDSIIKIDSFFVLKIIANPIYTLHLLTGATVMMFHGQSRIENSSVVMRQ